MTRRAVAAAALAAAVMCASCADTVIEVDDSAQVDADGSVAVPTTIPIVGSTQELLVEMATEMSTLSAQIADVGDERSTLRRIEAIWLVAQPDVASSMPELVGGMQSTVDMARTAVVRVRPADADKAFSILSDLVDRYTGDG